MSNPVETARRGIVNQGAFFSPYYLFDLLARQHADELDREGREANRRLLRRPFRAAWARYGESGSTPGQAWQAWHRELLEALGFLGDPEGSPLQRLETPVETSRHGLVPISHAAYDARDGESPLVLVDLHGFATDLDRDYYPDSGTHTLDGQVTEESIARAVEFALDYNETRWAIVAAGDRLRLYRKGGSVARQYLEVNFPALFDGDRNDEWTAFWGLFRYQAFVPDPETGKCLLDRVLEASQRHATRIADDLRENIVVAVEALIQGILDDPANKPILAKILPSPAGGRGAGGEGLRQLFEESLYFLYRLLFILYSESRDLLPVGESLVYRDTYSVEHLREVAERPLHSEDADKTYHVETLRALFKMLYQGFPPPSSALNPGFEIPPFNGQLFDPQRTALLDRCRIPDRAMRQVIRELSLSRPRRRRERRERYSYADLGVDQLGSIYEGLLVYEPTIVTEETVVAKVKGEERLVSLAQAQEYGLEIVEDSLKRPGSFVLRLWGGRRKGTGSYYTPQEITSFLVKEALEPLVEPIVQGCGERDKRGRPKRRPEEILELKVCDPAMGSGAFLIQACRYLAEAYGRARIAAGLDEDQRISQEEFARYKRRVAEKCLYGVDLNPLAVELAKVSLWLETLARDRPLTFLDAHLRCGNSLIGAPLRDDEGAFTVRRLSAIPDEALKEVSKEATREQKAAARERIKRNREETKRLQEQREGQDLLPGVDWGVISLREIEAALADTLTRRLDLEASDEDLPLAQAVELVYEKEQRFEELQHAAESRYRQAKQVCDLWCAGWFWPEAETEIEVKKDGQSCTVVVPEPPTTQVFLELAGGTLGTDPGSLTQAEREAYLLTAQHVADEQRFFHWELELPEVWREKNGQPKKNGGFDALVGNPPWEIVKPDSQEFWSNYNPLFRQLGKQAAIRFADELRQSLEIDQSWRRYSGTLQRTNHLFRTSGVYTNQGRGDLNTYKLFLERAYKLLHEGGGLSFVVPSGLYTDQGVTELRQLLFDHSAIRCLLSLENRKEVFPIHRSYKVVLFCTEKGKGSDSVPAAFYVGKDINGRVRTPGLDELPGLLAELDGRLLRMPIAAIRKFSPDTLSLMELRNQHEVDIVTKIYDDHPLMGENVPDSWNVEFHREFHMTDDSRLFNSEELGVPLYEGKMIYQFDASYEPPRYWIEEDVGRCWFQERYSEAERYSYECYRLTYRAVASSTNERSLITAVIPKSTFSGHSLNVLDPSLVSYMELLFISTMLNSLIVDFTLRQKVSANLTMYYLYQLPLPRLQQGKSHFDALVSHAARLTCTTPEFPDLWNEVAQYYPDAMPAPWQPEYTATDPYERAQFRAEVDALVADLYGLSEEDFAYTLTTFPLLDRDWPPLPGEPKSFITRDLALLALFKLRGKTPPSDIVDFFAAAGADISAITGPLRDLEQRVVEATRLGAVAYIPSGRGGEIEVEPEEAEVQLDLFEERNG